MGLGQFDDHEVSRELSWLSVRFLHQPAAGYQRFQPSRASLHQEKEIIMRSLVYSGRSRVSGLVYRISSSLFRRAVHRRVVCFAVALNLLLWPGLSFSRVSLTLQLSSPQFVRSTPRTITRCCILCLTKNGHWNKRGTKSWPRLRMRWLA